MKGGTADTDNIDGGFLVHSSDGTADLDGADEGRLVHASGGEATLIVLTYAVLSIGAVALRPDNVGECSVDRPKGGGAADFDHVNKGRVFHPSGGIAGGDNVEQRPSRMRRLWHVRNKSPTWV